MSSHNSTRTTHHAGPVDVAMILAEQRRLENAVYHNNEVDPLHSAPISTQNLEMQREFLRNSTMVNAQQVGRGVYYTLPDGRKMLSFADPNNLQYQSGV